MFRHNNILNREIGTETKTKDVCFIGVTRYMIETPSDEITEIVVDGIVSRTKNVLGFNESNEGLLAKAYKSEAQAEEDVLARLKSYPSMLSNLNKKFVTTSNKNDLPKESYWLIIINSNAEHINELIMEAKKQQKNGNSAELAKCINAIVVKIVAATEPSGQMVSRDRSRSLENLFDRLYPKF